MNFKKSITPLGSGKTTFASRIGDKWVIYLSLFGAIRGVESDPIKKTVKDLGVVSLAAECLSTSKGKFEKIETLYFQKNIETGD